MSWELAGLWPRVFSDLISTNLPREENLSSFLFAWFVKAKKEIKNQSPMGANYLTNQREILANAFLLGNQKSQ